MKQAKILTDAEVKRVLAVIEANRHAKRNRIVFQLSHLAALRAIEIASLRVRDVVDSSRKVKSQIVLEASMTKGKERHRVMVSTKLQRELQQYVDSVCADYRLDEPLIRTQQKTHFSPLTLVQLFANIYKKSGIDGASSHSGRRSCLTRLSDMGVSVRVIQAVARHSSLSTTQKYIEVSDTKLENAVELL